MVNFLLGIGILLLFLLADLLFCVVLNWLDKAGIAGASWLAFGRIELFIATCVTMCLWVISFFRWHKQFRRVALIYTYIVISLFGVIIPIIIPGFLSIWFYKKGLWPIAAIFRLIEVGTCISFLICLTAMIFMEIRALFAKTDL